MVLSEFGWCRFSLFDRPYVYTSDVDCSSWQEPYIIRELLLSEYVVLPKVRNVHVQRRQIVSLSQRDDVTSVVYRTLEQTTTLVPKQTLALGHTYDKLRTTWTGTDQTRLLETTDEQHYGLMSIDHRRCSN